MRTMTRVATAILAVGIFGAKAESNGPTDRKHVIGNEGVFDENTCKSEGLPAIRIVQGPKNGRVSIKDGTTLVKWGANDPHKCNLITVKTRMLVYRPNNGFIGDETIRYELKYPPRKKFPVGSTTSVHITIKVTADMKSSVDPARPTDMNVTPVVK